MRDTQAFLKWMNERNEQIAEEEEKRRVEGIDQVREARVADQREKWGQLRARERARGRVKQVSNVFGHTKID